MLGTNLFSRFFGCTLFLLREVVLNPIKLILVQSLGFLGDRHKYIQHIIVEKEQILGEWETLSHWSLRNSKLPMLRNHMR